MKFKLFYPRQPFKNRKKYSNLIMGIAQTSFIYSDNPKPFIHYRVAEKMFCKSFSAEDKSRQDLSVDAVKVKDGIGIKTFISGSRPLKYEKIAEFVDRSKYPLSRENTLKMVKQVAEYRNKRLKKTIETFDLNNTLYHYLVRDIGKIYICECTMIPIDFGSIALTPGGSRGNKVGFSDKYFNYYFHLSKHTLFKEFPYQKPLRILEIKSSLDETLLTWAIKELSNKESLEIPLLKKYEYVLLPLYSTRYGDVPERSGLNQWNAGGRPRDENEVYIPIPRIVHKKKPGFFPPRDQKFTLHTQDGKKFSAKVCQEGSKALMSDPNRDLGEWLLRDILKLPPGEVVTYEHLRNKNADTVIIYKINPSEYIISLHSFGTFESEYKRG